MRSFPMTPISLRQEGSSQPWLSTRTSANSEAIRSSLTSSMSAIAAALIGLCVPSAIRKSSLAAFPDSSWWMEVKMKLEGKERVESGMRKRTDLPARLSLSRASSRSE